MSEAPCVTANVSKTVGVCVQPAINCANVGLAELEIGA